MSKRKERDEEVKALSAHLYGNDCTMLSLQVTKRCLKNNVVGGDVEPACFHVLIATSKILKAILAIEGDKKKQKKKKEGKGKKLDQVNPRP
tara:strand:+ start:86 stop:358 length:273 start_codon:yes stop_codon:yes gene_type:complete